MMNVVLDIIEQVIFLLSVWDRRKKIWMVMDWHERSARPIPLRSVRLIAMSGMVVECEWSVYLFILCLTKAHCPGLSTA